MSKVGVKRECPTCHKFVEVLELTPIADRPGWYNQKLSCDHDGSIRIMEPMEERIEITDKVEAEVIKVRTLEGPLLVSGDSGITRLVSGNIELTTNIGGGQVFNGSVTFNQNNYYGDVSSVTTVNNIQNILSMVDSNINLTSEQKTLIKDTLTTVTDIIKNTGQTASAVASFLPLISKIFSSWFIS